ncbi:MAG: hypothetical protein HY698_06335 [Deltaproteobacteria bacterium]|nr:hypothetical protein [Deltaproteobacteria bacterium]
MNLRLLQYRDPAAVTIGLGQLRRQGLTPRGVIFIALDPRGETHIAVLEDFEEVTKIRVGDKLSLQPPWAGRFYYFDSIHRLPPGGVLWNGDRRLSQPGSASEVACGLADWIKGNGAKNVFLGCAPHQPGAWHAKDDRNPAVALHDRGFVDVVTTATGLLARRIGEPMLYHQPYATLIARSPLEGWAPVFESPLGNILLLERRVLGNRLVLTCERGLVEVEVGGLPKIQETAKVELASGFGVVGRVDGGAFAVTCGTKEPWGLADVQPALLVGARGDTLRDLALSLSKPSP